jgi:hypothetical protein
VAQVTLREMLLTLAYAAWWALGGWAFGAGVRALFGVDVVLVCALSNVIIGLLFLLPVVGDERRRRLFFEGPREQERSDPGIGLLWVFPFAVLVWGLLWWLMGRFG